jgi:hypothetical protein
MEKMIENNNNSLVGLANSLMVNVFDYENQDILGIIGVLNSIFNLAVDNVSGAPLYDLLNSLSQTIITTGPVSHFAKLKFNVYNLMRDYSVFSNRWSQSILCRELLFETPTLQSDPELDLILTVIEQTKLKYNRNRTLAFIENVQPWSYQTNLELCTKLKVYFDAIHRRFGRDIATLLIDSVIFFESDGKKALKIDGYDAARWKDLLITKSLYDSELEKRSRLSGQQLELESKLISRTEYLRVDYF